MTISLPYLWVYGHALAAVGAAIVLAHLFWPIGRSTFVCIAGGLVACLFLGHILWSIHRSFHGPYAVVAWVIAFLAGYACSAPLAYGVRYLSQRRRAAIDRRPAVLPS